MKTLFLFLCLPAFCSLHGQSFRRYLFHSTPVPGCTNEVYETAGDFITAGETISLVGTGFTHGQYLSLLSTQNYSSFISKHFNTDGVPVVPKCVYRKGAYTYATIAMLSGTQSNYAVLKLQHDGTLLAMKKIGQFPIDMLQASNVLLYPIAGSDELLLCFHTVATDHTSEIHFYSVDEDFNPTSIGKKIAFTEAMQEEFNAVGNCGLFLSDSNLHYNLLMDDGTIARMETGRINIHTGAVTAQWSTPVNGGSANQRNKIVQVKNDTVYHLVNSTLAIYPYGSPAATYYAFNNDVMDCKGLAQTETGEWIGIFSNHITTSALGRFRTISGTGLDLYDYGLMVPSTVEAKADTFSILGKYDNCALAWDECNVSNLTDCHPFLRSEPFTVTSVPLHTSQVTVSALSPTFGNLPFFTEANLLTTPKVICNPNALDIAENLTESIQVYPNPSTDYLTIHSNAGSISGIILRNMAGSTVFQNQFTTAEYLTLDLTGFSSGMYVLEIETATGSRFQKISKL